MATAEADVPKTAAESGYMQSPAEVEEQRWATVHFSTVSIGILLLFCF